MKGSFQTWHVEIWVEGIDELSPSGQDEYFDELPTSKDIAKALSVLFESRCEIRVQDTGYSDLAIERGKL